VWFFLAYHVANFKRPQATLGAFLFSSKLEQFGLSIIRLGLPAGDPLPSILQIQNAQLALASLFIFFKARNKFGPFHNRLGLLRCPLPSCFCKIQNRAASKLLSFFLFNYKPRTSLGFHNRLGLPAVITLPSMFDQFKNRAC